MGGGVNSDSEDVVDSEASVEASEDVAAGSADAVTVSSTFASASTSLSVSGSSATGGIDAFSWSRNIWIALGSTEIISPGLSRVFGLECYYEYDKN